MITALWGENLRSLKREYESDGLQLLHWKYNWMCDFDLIIELQIQFVKMLT